MPQKKTTRAIECPPGLHFREHSTEGLPGKAFSGNPYINISGRPPVKLLKPLRGKGSDILNKNQKVGKIILLQIKSG